MLVEGIDHLPKYNHRMIKLMIKWWIGGEGCHGSSKQKSNIISKPLNLDTHVTNPGANILLWKEDMVFCNTSSSFMMVYTNH